MTLQFNIVKSFLLGGSIVKYFVVKDLNTDLYFLGNGVNKWGRYFNQASIYRIKGAAHSSIKYLETRRYDS